MIGRIPEGLHTRDNEQVGFISCSICDTALCNDHVSSSALYYKGTTTQCLHSMVGYYRVKILLKIFKYMVKNLGYLNVGSLVICDVSDCHTVDKFSLFNNCI